MPSEMKSFSITRKEDVEHFKTFDRLRGILQLKRSEAIMKALCEFNTNHPIDKTGLLTDFTNGKPIIQTPSISLYTSFKELRKICYDMDKDKLLALKEQAKKFISAVELELESRVDR